MRRSVVGLLSGVFVSTMAVAGVPTGYTLLDYLESTGTQAIDTGIVPGSRIRTVLDFALTAIPTSGKAYCGWGASAPNGIAGESYLFGTSALGYFCNISEHWDAANELSIAPDLNWHVWDVGNGSQVFDGSVVGSSVIGDTAAAGQTLFIFGAHTEWTKGVGASNFMKVRIASCRMYDGTTLTRDFVAVRRDSDNVLGMYDQVNGVFYTNIATGTFTAGPETAASDVLTVAGSPLRYAQNGLPAYGRISGLAEGAARTIAAPADDIMVDASTRVRCVGWDLYQWDEESHDFVLGSSSTEETRLSCSYVHGATAAKLVWKWALEYRFDTGCLGDGSVETSSPIGWYGAEQQVTLTATAGEGYAFAGWQGNVPEASRNDNPLVLTIGTAAVSVKGAFESTAPQTAVYLKADAMGTGSGKSWANAHTVVSNAVNDAEAKGLPIYAAEGFYIIDNWFDVHFRREGWALYGGFPGVSDRETVDDRDPELHQTIFTGDRTMNDTWVHVVPDENFGYTQTNTGVPVYRNGRINPHPPYTGEYDAYVMEYSSPQSETAMLIYANGTMDGIIFSGFYTGSGHFWNYTPYYPTNDLNSAVYVWNKNCSPTISNCKFIGNCKVAASLQISSSATISNCVFAYNKSAVYATCLELAENHATTRVVDCTFESNFSPNAYPQSCGAVIWSASSYSTNIFERCAFSRDLLISNGKSCGLEMANICHTVKFAMSSFTDCCITNCLTTSATTNGISMFNGFGDVQLTRVHFANNRYDSRPAAGQVHAMIGVAHVKDWTQASSYTNPASMRPASMTFDGCSFEKNRLYARTPWDTSASGEYALTMIGAMQSYTNTAGRSCDVTVNNCSFLSNTVEAVYKKDGLLPLFCRGVLALSGYESQFDLNVSAQAGVANSFFHGPVVEGVYDVVQWGETTNNVPLRIVNSVFTAPGNAQISPIYATSSNIVEIIDTTIQNKVSTEGEGFVYKGLGFDKIPFVREPVGNFGGFALRADALTPHLGLASPVATNHVAAPFSYAYRDREDGVWKLLNTNRGDYDSANWETRIATDAKGDVRTAESFRRGPLQVATEKAETGANIVLRCDPFDKLSLEGEAVQSVVSGQSISPVTIVARDSGKSVCAGWYDQRKVCVSSDPCLSGVFPNGITVLTARYLRGLRLIVR